MICHSQPNCLLHNISISCVQIQYIDQHHIISVSERHAYCWNLQGTEPKRIYQVRNLPDCSAIMNTNTILMHRFEEPQSVVVSGDGGGGGQRHVPMLYCLAGHKLSIGDLHKRGSPGESAHHHHTHNTLNHHHNLHKRGVSGTKEGDQDVRLTRSYVHDCNDVKLNKSRMHISSACLLPLRRMLLVGTTDGLIRAVV